MINPVISVRALVIPSCSLFYFVIVLLKCSRSCEEQSDNFVVYTHVWSHNTCILLICC